VIEIGRRFGFRAKPGNVGSARQLPGQDHLEGHFAIERDLPRSKYHSHSAASDFFKNFVVSEISDFRRKRDSHAVRRLFRRKGRGVID